MDALKRLGSPLEVPIISMPPPPPPHLKFLIKIDQNILP